MAGWHRGPLAAFDLETTGVSVEEDRIVTACIARVDGAGPAAPVVKTWLIDPGIDIPAGATEIHGITTERARAEGAEPVIAVAEIIDMLARALDKGVPIVGFNVGAYDLSLLDREARRYGLPPLADVAAGGVAPVVDAYVLDKHVSYRRGSRKLSACCEHYKVRIDGAHDAAHDALAAARIAWKIAAQYPSIGGAELAELHAKQIEWKAEQDASFAKYLRDKARVAKDVDEQIELNRRADSCTGAWPVVPCQQRQGVISGA